MAETRPIAEAPAAIAVCAASILEMQHIFMKGNWLSLM
jgi:hypothetical protein